jgi:RimJ/RimL family protein N-acetyltransferase
MPVIETARLLLRRPAMEDLDGYATAWGDADVMRYLPGRTPRTSQAGRTDGPRAFEVMFAE